MNTLTLSPSTASDTGAAKENKRLSESQHALLKSTSSLSTTSSTESALSSCTSSLSSGSPSFTKHSLKIDQSLSTNGKTGSIRSTHNKLLSKMTSESQPPSLNRRTTPQITDDNCPAEISDLSFSHDHLAQCKRFARQFARRRTGQSTHNEDEVKVSSLNSISLSNSNVTCGDHNTSFCQKKEKIYAIRNINCSTKETDLGGSEKEFLLHTWKYKLLTKEESLSNIKNNETQQTPNTSTQTRPKRGPETEFQLSPASHQSSRAVSCRSSLASTPSSQHSPQPNSSHSSCYPSPTDVPYLSKSPPKSNRQNMYPSLPFQKSPPPTLRINNINTGRSNDDYSNKGSSRYNDNGFGSGPDPLVSSYEKTSSMFPAAANAAAAAAATAVRQRQQRLKYKIQEEHLMRVLSGKRCNEERGIRSHSMPTSSANESQSNSSSPTGKSQSSALEHDFEMIIHPQSVPGTTEAAAWHLHGQTGGRTPKFGIHPNNSNSVVMDVSAMERMRETQHDGDVFEIEYNDVKRRMDETLRVADTGVKVTDLEGGITTVTADSPGDFDNHSDMWSTGVATAVAIGAVSRYKKALCMFPHGRRVLLPIMMGILAFALSMITSLSCQFMTILPVQKNHQVFQVGPWRYLSIYKDYETCLPYPSDIELDSFFMISRSASALASCFGGGLVLWMCTLTCLPHTKLSLNGLGICFFITSILQLFTVLFFQSENCKGKRQFDEYGNALGGGYFGGTQCRPNQDLVFCIAASLLYFATGAILYLSHKFISAPGFSTSEVYTWSAVSGSSNRKKGILRTIEKCWAQLPDGSTVMATVLVEKKRGKDGKTKTTHSIQTEILPA